MPFSVAGSMLKPAPGRSRCVAATRPSTSAKVETISKYSSALPPTRPTFFMSLHAGDAGDHGAEDDRADDHLDQLDEAVAERLHVDGERRVVVAEDHADDDGEDHLHIEHFVEGFLLHDESSFQRGEVSLENRRHARGRMSGEAIRPRGCRAATSDGLRPSGGKDTGGASSVVSLLLSLSGRGIGLATDIRKLDASLATAGKPLILIVLWKLARRTQSDFPEIRKAVRPVFRTIGK